MRASSGWVAISETSACIAGPHGRDASVLITELMKVSSSLRVSPTSTGSSKRGTPNRAAAGLVVLLSTTPTIAGTPLQGANTNLAGVFQINDVTRVKGLKRTFNSWIVTVPGFFGKGEQATLTVYAVNGTAPPSSTATRSRSRTSSARPSPSPAHPPRSQDLLRSVLPAPEDRKA
jgi:hypothetical protein